MSKFLSLTALFLTVFSAGTLAQETAGGSAQGNKTVSLILGNNPMFSQNLEDQYLLPDYSKSSVGLPETPGVYLNMAEVGSNNLMNMVGVQYSQQILDILSVNAMFSMNICATPKKDFEEGVSFGGALDLPAKNYIEGRLKTNWFASVGANYHFSVSNKHMQPYGGVRFGTQMGRIQTYMPYTGVTADGIETEAIFRKSSRCGSVWSLSPAIVGGVDCVLNCGIVLGIEVSPVSYSYSAINIEPNASYNYSCETKEVKFFSNPVLKLGFRF